jgi:SAM-dependent methyltransferase
MKKSEDFYRHSLERMFKDKKLIVDIGGGLRVDPKKNNRGLTKRSWLLPLVKNVDYKILDKVPDYNPDIVGDVQDLPLSDNSVDAFIADCILTHLEEPQKAMREMYRCLKPGGYIFLFLPFLYYYHPLPGYYKDYFRFTKDGIEYMMKDFSTVELQSVRGPIETIMNLLPMFSKKTGMFGWLDKLLRPNSNQVSGYYIFGIK